MGWGVYDSSQEHLAASANAAAATPTTPSTTTPAATAPPTPASAAAVHQSQQPLTHHPLMFGMAGASHHQTSLKQEAQSSWPACQMSSPATSSGLGLSSASRSGSHSNLLSPPASSSSSSSLSSSSEKKLTACRFSGGGIGMGNTMAPNSYSLDSAQHFGGPQQLAMAGHGKQMQIQSQQHQQYYMNDVSAGQHYPGLPPPAFAYGGGGVQAAAGGGVGLVAGHHNHHHHHHHQVVSSGYDLMTGGGGGGGHPSAAVAAAAAAARSCALPSPTIYPPTPPPSAPWVHPWFLGDTF